MDIGQTGFLSIQNAKDRYAWKRVEMHIDISCPLMPINVLRILSIFLWLVRDNKDMQFHLREDLHV